MLNKKILDITIIIPTFNMAKTLGAALESLKKQDYPIKEIIIIDNHSDDHSLVIAEKFKKANKQLKIKIIRRKKTYGISSSYNFGAKIAKGDYLVTLHADSLLPTKKELRRLILPLTKDPSAIVAQSLMVMPRRIWLAYNFWQKCLFAREVDRKIRSGNGKFDCYQKKAFLSLGGYDEKRFSHTLGAEDADMYIRFRKRGKVVLTKARVIHNHGIDPNYSLKDWLLRRRFLAVSYGQYLKLHFGDMKMQVFVFLIKPLLAFISPLSLYHPFLVLPILLFPFIYLPKMFLEPSARQDSRILFLPLIVILLIYAETYWMLKSFFFLKKKV